MSEYIVKLPTYGAADEFFKTHEMPDMTLYGYPLTDEIVRCRDCKWFRQDMSDHEYRSGWWCDMGRFDPYPDGYCAWGEREVDA